VSSKDDSEFADRRPPRGRVVQSFIHKVNSTHASPAFVESAAPFYIRETVIYLHTILDHSDKMEIGKARGEKKEGKGKREAVHRLHGLAARINEAMLRRSTGAVAMCCD
jgi:hypothetical protein